MWCWQNFLGSRMEAQRISGTCLQRGLETWAGKWVPKLHATRHYAV